MGIWFAILLPILIGLGIIGVLWFVYAVFDEFGFLGLLVAAAICGAVRLIFSIVEAVKGEAPEEEESCTIIYENEKQWGYRKAGSSELKSGGGMKSCSKCKHYSTTQCTMQLDSVDGDHICYWYDEG